MRPPGAAALALGALLAWPAASGRAEVPRPPPLAQEGNACLPTSAAMALHSLGVPTTPRDVARNLPFHPDGTDFFDLQEELSRREVASLVFVGGPAEIAAAVEAGVPVVAAVHGGETKHAVLIWGARRGEGEGHLRYIDPRGGVAHEVPFEDFARVQYARQLLVVWTRAEPAEERLTASGFPLEAARAANARFRAEALVLRAARHAEPNRQALELLRRAVGEDPSWEVARDRLRAVEDAVR
jgi:hypothetical protein